MATFLNDFTGYLVVRCASFEQVIHAAHMMHHACQASGQVNRFNASSKALWTEVVQGLRESVSVTDSATDNIFCLR